MNRLHLHTSYDCSSTVVSNIFIDRFMSNANGEFVKIYIYLLRCVSDQQTTISVSGLADFFNQTEADVRRALKYWDKQGVLVLTMDETDKEVADITFVDLSQIYLHSAGTPKVMHGEHDTGASNVMHGEHDTGVSKLMHDEHDTDMQVKALPSGSHLSSGGDHSTKNIDNIRISINTEGTSRKKEPIATNRSDYAIITQPVSAVDTRTAYTPKQISAIKESSNDFAMSLFVAEKYFERPLSPTEMSTLAYFYDTLHFNTELIDYLIEYCVTKGHKSFRYIEKVALAWSDKGITTAKEAKAASTNYLDVTYTVLEAFGINNRAAAKIELDYINKWHEMFSGNTNIILEACNRTIKATHQPSWEYADKILTTWKDADVKTTEDIRRIDESYEKVQADKKRTNTASTAKGVNVNSKNRFNNFHQRDIDMESLEKELLGNS